MKRENKDSILTGKQGGSRLAQRAKGECCTAPLEMTCKAVVPNEVQCAADKIVSRAASNSVVKGPVHARDQCCELKPPKKVYCKNVYNDKTQPCPEGYTVDTRNNDVIGSDPYAFEKMYDQKVLARNKCCKQLEATSDNFGVAVCPTFSGGGRAVIVFGEKSGHLGCTTIKQSAKLGRQPTPVKFKQAVFSNGVKLPASVALCAYPQDPSSKKDCHGTCDCYPRDETKANTYWCADNEGQTKAYGQPYGKIPGTGSRLYLPDFYRCVHGGSAVNSWKSGPEHRHHRYIGFRYSPNKQLLVFGSDG